jgi:AraC-like DNA-binding protein
MKKNSFIGYLRSLLWGRKQKKKWQLAIDEQAIEELHYRLVNLLEQKKPFLQQGYHLRDMAAELHLHEYQLSAFLNQVMRIHFTELLNQYRIAHCIDLLRTKAIEKPTVKEMINRCGFRNRNTFTTAFKKFTGHNFSHYVKQL